MRSKINFHKKYCIIAIFILLIAGGICAIGYKFAQNDYKEYDEFENNEEDKFFEKVLEIIWVHSFWLSINVDSPEYKGKAVIENDLLYSYFDDKQLFFNEYKYKKIMHKMLKEKSALKIEKKSDFAKYWSHIEKKGDFGKYWFHIVPNDTSVIENAKKGFENFIETYTEGLGTYSIVLDKNEEYNSFTIEELRERYGKLTKKELFLKGNLILKRDLSDEKRNAVISQFFDFKIMVIRDCESGQFRVYK